MIGKGFVVENDLYDIASRIKGIDCGYFVFYSYAAGRYEIHHSGQRGGTLALVVPYERLDNRAVELVLRTRRERRDKLLAEIEAHNARLAATGTKQILENAAQLLN